MEDLARPGLAEDAVLRQLLDKYIDEAEKAFQKRIAAEGLVLTGELLNSFRKVAAQAGLH